MMQKAKLDSRGSDASTAVSAQTESTTGADSEEEDWGEPSSDSGESDDESAWAPSDSQADEDEEEETETETGEIWRMEGDSTLQDDEAELSDVEKEKARRIQNAAKASAAEAAEIRGELWRADPNEMHTEKGEADMKRKSAHAATLEAMARAEGVVQQEVHEIKRGRIANVFHRFQQRRKATAGGDEALQAAEAATLALQAMQAPAQSRERTS